MTHKQKIIISIIALFLAGILVSGCWALWKYVIPRDEKISSISATSIVTSQSNNDLNSTGTDLPNDGEIKLSATSYQSSKLSINITTVKEENLLYYIADVIMADTGLFQTAFAQDRFGINVDEDALALAARNNAILAINGDYYGWRDDGIIIRNGELYRNKPVRDMLAIYNDGTMKILNEKEYSSDEKIIELLNDGVIDTFSYGPALIINGEKVSDLSNSGRYLNKKHPRTAIGMIAPFHFVFVVVDGRIDESEGVDLASLADIMEDLGCTEAYNFDGGASSIMIFNGEKINILKTRDLSDIIYFPEAQR